MPTEQELITTDHLPLDNSSDNSAITFPTVNQQQLAWLDVKDGIVNWRIWLMLAYHDIKLRYRRSILGPFWITLSMAITVYAMGFIYAHLFHVTLDEYYPFLVSGMIIWSLLSTLIIEFTDGFITADSLIKQIKLPYTLHIHRITTRNFIIFFHNLLVMLPIMVIYHLTAPVTIYSLLVIPGLCALYVNSVMFGMIISLIGARYRDMSQIIKSLVQIVFFVTPIMWNPNTLSEQHRFLINLNPIYAFVQLIREPLIGKAPTLINLLVVLATTAVGAIICSSLFTRYRARIVYWL